VDDVICEDESHREVIWTLESPAFRRGEGSTFAVKMLLFISEVALIIHFARESMDDG